MKKIVVSLLVGMHLLANSSDTPVQLQINHLPYNPSVDTAGDPMFYIYRAHPWYPYALNSKDPAVWQKVESACALLALSNLPNYIGVAFSTALAQCRQEQQNVINNGGSALYPTGDVSLSIPITGGSQNTIASTYMMAPGFEEATSLAHNYEKLPQPVDMYCSYCMLSLLDSIPSTCQQLRQAITTGQTFGDYTFLKDTIKAGQQLAVSGFNSYIACIVACYGNLAVPEKNAFKRAALNGQSRYPVANVIVNSDANHPLPYHW